MPSYDSARVDPPAPIADIELIHPEAGVLSSTVAMLIDSGADVTLLPSRVIDEITVPFASEKEYQLVGFDGTPSVSRAVRLKLRFSGRTFQGLFLLIDQECGILGRNILNALLIVLDGPNLQWFELHRS